MTLPTDRRSLQLHSRLTADGEIELSLVRVRVPSPKAHEVVVRIDAAPLNPSDLGLLLGPADWTAPRTAGSGVERRVSAPVAPGARAALAARLDVSMPVGNEGAGLVVEAGAAPAAQRLLGKNVALLAGASYAQYRCVPADACLELASGTTAREGASAFVNPLTALGMLTTLRREGHRAMVHTAAASNLGRMLDRLYRAEGVPLVNIVRGEQSARVLLAAGAAHVLRSDQPDFRERLTAAIESTGATLAFDAVGGGTLVSEILAAMERALGRSMSAYSRYGSTTHKQAYLYGSLDPSPTELRRSYGMAWGVGGWLVTPFLESLDAAAVAQLKARVAAELKTTFASEYSAEISLSQALEPATIAAYGRRTTGEKYLINPNLPL
jgi:NADPH:quinone reductase